MTVKKIGILDYSVGNHASVLHSFVKLGYQCQVSADKKILSDSNLIVLPGVGSFPAAIGALEARGLINFIKERAQAGQPIIGLCLGMQLLADESCEHGNTKGLGLIPGKVVPLSERGSHIGWNSIEVINNDPLFSPSGGDYFYFNHSYIFDVIEPYRACLSRVNGVEFASVVRNANIVGIQFHPEKSQISGRNLLKNIVDGMGL